MTGRSSNSIHEIAVQRLHKINQRYSSRRRRLVDALVQSAHPMTAPDIVALDADLPQSSVYRNLAVLEAAGVVKAIITQAVDHLHAKAGQGDLIEVHANVLSCKCTRCDDVYALSEVQGLLEASDDGVPRCTREGCGYPLRPTGTLWGEPLVEQAIIRAWDMAAWCDLFLILDTQLRTDPMAMLPSVPLKRGTKVAIVGTTRTHYDRYAKLVIARPSPEVLPGLAELLLDD